MLPPILAAMQRAQHVVFLKGDYNLNIFGIRSKVKEADKFDDILGCAYKAGGAWVVHYWAATTDPSTYYLIDHPLRPEGTAILIPGQYRSTYKIDKHGKSQYEALCQRGGKVKVWRDNTHDEILDHNEDSVEEGHFGINIHASTSNPYTGVLTDRTDGTVGAWSAGCQVFARETDFRRFMALVKRAEAKWGQWFTYTLLTEDQTYGA